MSINDNFWGERSANEADLDLDKPVYQQKTRKVRQMVQFVPKHCYFKEAAKATSTLSFAIIVRSPSACYQRGKFLRPR